jgi:hypothetical protein
LNGKYNIINKQVSAQNEQILVKEGLQTNVPYISGTRKKLLKQTLPKRGPFLIPFLENDTLQLSATEEDNNPTHRDVIRH